MKSEKLLYVAPRTTRYAVLTEGTFASSIGNDETMDADIETQPGNENGDGEIGEDAFGDNPWL